MQKHAGLEMLLFGDILVALPQRLCQMQKLIVGFTAAVDFRSSGMSMPWLILLYFYQL